MSCEFRYGHASRGRWQDAVAACLSTIKPVPLGANLGFFYFNDRFIPHAAQMLAALKRETGIESWVGSAGMGVIATGVEYMDQPAIAVMVGGFPERSFSVFSGRARPPVAGTRTASGAAAAHFAVVHGDPATSDMADLIEDMAGKLESGAMVGGLTSSRDETAQIADVVLRGGLSGVVFSSDIGVVARITQGCTPLVAPDGKPRIHRVTSAEEGGIQSLDDRPALDVFRECVGAEEAADLRRAVRTHLVGVVVPESGGSDYLVRNIVAVDAVTGSIGVGGGLREGDFVVLVRRDGEAAREDLARMLGVMRTAIGGTPRAGLYFSCIARGSNLFGETGVEPHLIRDALGDFPMVGFFANGEISQGRLYGYTGVLALFT